MSIDQYSVEALASLLESSELTLAQMGKIMGCRAGRVTEILNGTKELSKDQIVRLCAYFKMSTDFFLQAEVNDIKFQAAINDTNEKYGGMLKKLADS